MPKVQASFRDVVVDLIKLQGDVATIKLSDRGVLQYFFVEDGRPDRGHPIWKVTEVLVAYRKGGKDELIRKYGASYIIAQ